MSVSQGELNNGFGCDKFQSQQKLSRHYALLDKENVASRMSVTRGYVLLPEESTVNGLRES